MAKYDKVFVSGLLILYVLVFSLLIQNLRYQYLHYDETVQFWISKGLNPESVPFSAEGNVFDVMENNQFYNLDPGGFGVMLHYWSKVSNHVIWLRALPFVFFLFTVVGFIYLGWRWFADVRIALAIGFIPILSPMMREMAFEIRAYSMEVLGITLALVALDHMKNRINLRWVLLSSFLISFFMLSRYSFVMAAFVFSLYLVWLIVKNKGSLFYKTGLLLVYALPVFSTLAGIYFMALKEQNASLEPLRYLVYLQDNISFLFEPLNILFLLWVSCCFWLLLRQKKYPFLQRYVPLLYMNVAVNILFIVLSFLGMHPWDPSSTRSITVVVLMAVSIAAVAGILLRELFKSPGILGYYIVMAFLLVVTLGKHESFLTRYMVRENNFFTLLDNDMDMFSSVYVDVEHGPYIRYFYEYGPMRNSHSLYPEAFTFQRQKRKRPPSFEEKISFDYSIPDSKALRNYDLLIITPLYERVGKDYGHWVLLPRSDSFWIQRPCL